jgi:DNA-binding response OmpR family regulator
MSSFSAAQTPSSPVLAGVRVLVRSADPDECEIFSAVLRDAGAEVETTTSVEAAFDAFQTTPPDVLVSDVDGPEGEHHRFIRQVRGLRDSGHVPALAVSSLRGEEHRAPALAAGFSQWMSRPAAHAMVDAVAALLGRESTLSLPKDIVPPTDLAVTPLSETIGRLQEARATGDLVVRSRKATKMLFFAEGRIVFAASNVMKERLGEALLSRGAISGRDFDRASRLMAQSRDRFGDALVAADVMKPEDLRAAVAEWVETIVGSLLCLETGSASFEERVCAIPEEYRAGVASAPVAAPAPARESAAHAAIRREIREQLEKSESLDTGTWLGLEGEASTERVVAALEQRKRAYEALRDALGADVEIVTDVELLLGRVAMALRLAQHVPAAPPAPEAEKESMAFEHLVMEADISASVGDFTSAARSYARMVDARPDVADYRVRLATAMARSPRLARQAEAQFQEAIRLEPHNAEHHFRLALYYKTMNVRSRSIAMLREVLRLDPHHEGAAAELDRR